MAPDGLSRRREDAALLAGLLALTYTVPARLRPALGLAVAVGLSRAHGFARERRLDELLENFNEQRRQVEPRVAALERRDHDELAKLLGEATYDRLDDLEQVVAELARSSQTGTGGSLHGLEPVLERIRAAVAGT